MSIVWRVKGGEVHDLQLDVGRWRPPRNSRARMTTARKAPDTCNNCKYAHKLDTALVCFGHPMAVVMDGKAVTMRPSVLPNDLGCVDYKRAANG